MQIRDRIKQLRRVRASELLPHPKNWRTHPAAQSDALRGVLAEVGYADALLVRELADGRLQLIDGHLRAETTPDVEVPVLVLDVDAEEAEKILLTLDPLAALATTDRERLEELLGRNEFDHPAVTEMLNGLNRESTSDSWSEKPEVEIPEAYQVVVECENETQQREVYERLTEEGFRCRVLTL